MAVKGRPKIVKKQIGNYEYVRKTIRYVDPEGNKKSKEIYGKTQAEFKSKLNEFMVSIDQAKVDYAEAKTAEEIESKKVKTLMAQWLIDFKKENVSSNTYQEYESNCKTWIYPHFSGKQITDVTPLDCQLLLNKMSLAGRSASTMKHIYLLICEFFEYAVQFDLIAKNPTRMLKKPKVTMPIPQPFTREEMDDILTFASTHCDPLNWLFFDIAVNTGMRASEIAGMTVEHIDFKKNVILVWRKIVDERVDGKRSWVAKDYLKTSRSKRPVSMGFTLQLMLESRIETGNLKKYIDGFTYIFQDPDGKPYHPDSYSQSFRYVVV